MAHIVIFEVKSGGDPEGGDDICYDGKARCSGMELSDDHVYWYAKADPSALAATINAAIIQAAIDAALEQKSIVVGILDKKTIIGGAVGL